MNANDPRLATAVTYLYSCIPDNIKNNSVANSDDWIVKIHDETGEIHTFNLHQLASVGFNPSNVRSETTVSSKNINAEEARIRDPQIMLDHYNDVLKTHGYSSADITFYNHWYKRIYSGEMKREALYGSVDERLTELDRVVKESSLKKEPEKV